MRYIWDWCVNAIPNGNISVIYSLWIPTVLIAFASLALITARMRELPSAYIVFFLAYYVLAMGCTWLLSCSSLPLRNAAAHGIRCRPVHNKKENAGGLWVYLRFICRFPLHVYA